ncbi:MAG: endonuclease [Candidatus Latescibacterota bacterium]
MPCGGRIFLPMPDSRAYPGQHATELGPELQYFHRALLAAYGPQGWWPTTPAGQVRPRYRVGVRRPLVPREQWEIAVGAVLTQNTAWRNVEQALGNLASEGLVSPTAVAGTEPGALAALLRPSGYYNQKARRLHLLATHVVEGYGGRIRALLRRPAAPLRQELLAVWGIGPETADSILLYAAGRPSFVIDTYTRRIMGRLGVVPADLSYQEMQSLFVASLPADPDLFGEYHALLVRHATTRCRSTPVCAGCVLRPRCAHGRDHTELP